MFRNYLAPLMLALYLTGCATLDERDEREQQCTDLAWEHGQAKPSDRRAIVVEMSQKQCPGWRDYL